MSTTTTTETSSTSTTTVELDPIEYGWGDDYGSCCCPDALALLRLRDLVREMHESTHAGPFRFCNDELCREAEGSQ